MGLGEANKRKGKNAEKFYAKLFQRMHPCFKDCIPSKKDRHHDHAKIDLMNLPFNIQIKAGRQHTMSPGKELVHMQFAIQTMFPKDDEVLKKPLLLFHHKEPEIREERSPELDLVYMSLVQFDLFKNMNKTLEYQSLKSFRHSSTSEFKHIVGMTFEYFKNEIILKHYINGISDSNPEGN